MDAKGSVNSWPWNGSMDLAGLLFVSLFRVMPCVCLQFWADRQDIWICRRTWVCLTNFTLLLLLLVFIFTSLFHGFICSGVLGTIWRTSQWLRQFWCRQYSHQKASYILLFFSSIFFYLLVSTGFPKGKKKTILGQKVKRSIKTSVLGIVFGSFLHQRCEMVHSLILRLILA